MLLYSICSAMLIWLKYVKKFDLITDMHSEKRSILVAFSDNCGYFSLISHQNWICGSFLKITCNVESETLSISISYSVALKSTSLSWILNGSFFQLCMVLTSCIGHSEDIGSLRYIGPLSIGIFLYRISKNHIVIIDLIRKVI